MSCFYCKNYKGLNNFCSRDRFVETGSESINCDEYQYNGKLKHYDILSDEKEVKQIIKNIMLYFLEMSLSELALGVERNFDNNLSEELNSQLNNIIRGF